VEAVRKRTPRGIIVKEDLQDLLFCLRKDNYGYKEIIEKALEKVEILNMTYQV
jgi:hypothetical protein